MNWLKRLFRKRLVKKIDELNLSNTLINEDSKNDNILVTGNRSAVFGIYDYPIPTGICSEPTSKELIEYIKQDKLGQLLNNPINHCIFYHKSTGYCFFGGLCDKKQKISNARVAAYKESMQLEILKMKEEQNK